ncbi:MAG TPA: hypothetical protein DGJ56_10045 [Verrucomicrobiales bacterium]|nr:hypothetical protein [Verrucomicrobiales bacterium]
MKKINDDKVDFISTALGVRTEMGVEMVRAAMECATPNIKTKAATTSALVVSLALLCGFRTGSAG